MWGQKDIKKENKYVADRCCGNIGRFIYWIIKFYRLTGVFLVVNEENVSKRLNNRCIVKSEPRHGLSS